jgi:peptidoglycan/LPS O-acetylase OafA/YrhL
MALVRHLHNRKFLSVYEILHWPIDPEWLECSAVRPGGYYQLQQVSGAARWMGQKRDDMQQPKQARAQGNYVVNIQILRFFAALLVVVAHVHAEILNIAARTSSYFGGIGLLDWGLGVDVFFVISGFIMYYMMRDRFREPGVSADFFRRRFIRVAPLYWICTTMMLVSILLAAQLINNNGLVASHVIASYAFIPWPREDGELFPPLSLGWTLNYEMFFYVIFAVALFMPRKLGLTALAAIFATFCAVGYAAPASAWPLKFWGDPIIGEFLLGIALAAVFLRGYRIGFPLAAAMTAAGLLLAIYLFQISAYQHVTRLVTGGLPAILITAAFTLSPSVRLGRITAMLALGGDASYSLYLIHPFAIKMLGIVASKLHMPLIGIFVFGMVAAVLVSVVFHLQVEKPLGRWLSQLTAQKNVARSGA